MLEKYLSDAEISCTAPGARYFLTFRLIDFRRRAELQPLRRLAVLLERTEKETRKQ